MNRRVIEKHILLTKEEAALLEDKAHKACLSQGSLIRFLLKGYEPKAYPDESFRKAMRELTSISNNVQQLAVKANALNFIDAPLLKEEVIKWNQFQTDVMKIFLQPDKSNLKWQ